MCIRDRYGNHFELNRLNMRDVWKSRFERTPTNLRDSWGMMTCVFVEQKNFVAWQTLPFQERCMPTADHLNAMHSGPYTETNWRWITAELIQSFNLNSMCVCVCVLSLIHIYAFNSLHYKENQRLKTRICESYRIFTTDKRSLSELTKE